MANPIPTATSFKPGKSGNPEGTRKNTLVRDCLLRINAQSDGNMVRNVCEKLVELAEEGEQWAVQELFNRIDGKPVQQVAGDDDSPIRLTIAWAQPTAS
jgi:hypothetical protein